MRRGRTIWLALFSVCAGVSPAHADPLATREQHALLASAGLPTALPAAMPPAQWSVQLDFDWSSTALIQNSARERLIIDAETQEMRITLTRRLSDRVALRLRAPHRRTFAGSLDGFIDDWHDAFSLPEGARPELAEDALVLQWTRESAEVFAVNTSRSGWGDVALDVGLAIDASPRRHAAVWLTLDAPTGRAMDLASDDAWNVGVGVAVQYALAARWQVFGQSAASWTENTHWLGLQRRELLGSALAGLTWRPEQRLSLTAQLEGRSSAFKHDALAFLGPSATLTVGGAIELPGWRLQLGVSEDVAVETTSDVTFLMNLHRTGRRRY